MYLKQKQLSLFHTPDTSKRALPLCYASSMISTIKKLAIRPQSRWLDARRFHSSSNLCGVLSSRWQSCYRPKQQSSVSSSVSKDRWFSSMRRSTPLSMMAKIEILSFGKDSEDNRSGILTGVIPVNSNVRAGDIVGTILVPPRIQTIQDGSNHTNDNIQEEQEGEKEVTIRAPQTGRVTEVFLQIQDRVKIGDHLMHIDDAIFQADMKELESQLQKMSIGQEGQQRLSLPKDYMKTLLDIDDQFRLQTIVERMPAPLQSQSLRLYERLMELQKDDPVELANTHTRVGVVMYNLGDLEMTLQHLHKALKLREEALGSDHPQVAATCIHLGSLYRNSGDFDKSLEFMLKAVDIQKKSLGEEHPVVASTYNNIGALHYQSNDFARAIREYEKALQIQLKTKGELHVDTAGTFHNLGVAWKHLGDLKTAQEYLQKSLHIRQKHYEQQEMLPTEEKGEGSNSSSAASDVAVSHTALGQLYAEMGNYEAAMEQYDAALAVQKRTFGSDSSMTATSYNNIGAIHYETGNFSEALKTYQTGLDILRANEPNHVDTAASWNNVGLTLLKMEEMENALEHHQEALRILTAIYGPKHPNLAMTIGSIGNVYKSQELWEKALAEYEVAHELLELALGTSKHPDIASSLNNMGLVLSQLPGREAEALEKYRASYESFEESLGSEHPHCGSCRYNIALMLQSQGLMEDAKTEFEAARDIWTTHFGPGHVHTMNAQKGIDECS